VVGAKFTRDFTCIALLRVPRHVDFNVGYRPLTFSGAPFLMLRLSSPQLCRPYNPADKSAVWAVPHSLAATNGITLRFLFHRVLRCFTSPSICWPTPVELAFPRVIGRWRLSRHRLPHSEIHGSWHNTAIRGLSQLFASFIALQCQGIHYTPALF
jgi:hypothetical protein